MRRWFKVLFISAFTASCVPGQNSEPAFNSGEHQMLGDAGYRSACEDQGLPCSTQLLRNDGKQSFTYGELVAFSGDFYRTPDALYFEKVASFFQWKRNDLVSIKDNFKKEVETVENFLHGHSTEKYPDFNFSYAWNFPDYLSAALANASHFGFYNMIAYIDYHEQALALALEAHAKAVSQSAEAQQLLNRALFMNAFADHFLTDGFASGHVRSPRVQILNWATAEGISERAAGTLSKVIHDRDGEIRDSGEHGLLVANARGDGWLTRCDAQLFWNNNLQDPSIVLPVQAVEASVREVLAAYEHGTVVDGVYAATELVPFPAADERPLIEIFSADMPEAEYDKIMGQMAFYTRIKLFSGVDKSVLKQMNAALPQIMQNFRDDVQKELLKNPRLSQRLPATYIEAYQNIR